MISRFLHAQSKSVTFSANLLTISSLISAVLGLIRNRLLLSFFGASHETDVYLAAFRIPDLVYVIFILGGISVAFVPLFSEYFAKSGEDGATPSKRAWDFANNLLNVLFVGLGIFSAILAVAAPLLIPFVAPGFSSEEKALTVSLMRLMFLSPIFFGVASVLSGIVQYFDRFVGYALAPIVYNLSIVAGIAFFAPFFGIWGVGFGVVGGALLYFLVQLPSAIHSGFRWKPSFKLFDPGILKVFRLAIPRLPGAIGYQINLIFMTALASTFSVGSITVFGVANDLQSFPINVLGVPFAIAAFPALSRAFVQKNTEQFRSTFLGACFETLFLALPLATLLFLLRNQIIHLAYGVGRFGQDETRLTAAVLGIFTLGVIFQALIPLCARAFFSIQNTKIPTLAGLASVALNIALAFFFARVLSFNNIFSQGIASVLHLGAMGDIRVLALPFALLVSGIFQCGVLLVLLNQQIHKLFGAQFFINILKIFIANAVLAVAVFIGLHIFKSHVFLQTLAAACLGGIAFLAGAWMVKSPQLLSVFHSLRHQFYGK